MPFYTLLKNKLKKRLLSWHSHFSMSKCGIHRN